MVSSHDGKIKTADEVSAAFFLDSFSLFFLLHKLCPEAVKVSGAAGRMPEGPLLFFTPLVLGTAGHRSDPEHIKRTPLAWKDVLIIVILIAFSFFRLICL